MLPPHLWGFHRQASDVIDACKDLCVEGGLGDVARVRNIQPPALSKKVARVPNAAIEVPLYSLQEPAPA